MRAACLALALCVSYAAAATPTTTLNEETAFDMDPKKSNTLKGREYIVKNVENNMHFKTAEFTVTGAGSAPDEKAYHGCFVDGELPGAETSIDVAAETKVVGECDVAGDVTGTSVTVSYKVYTKKGADKVFIGESADKTVSVLELKGTKPESWSIVREGCAVKFDILGIYSNPPLTSVCGFYQNKEWVEGASDSSTPEHGGWVEKSLSEDAAEIKAWELTDKSLEVSTTDKMMDVVKAGCKFYLEGQEFVEYELFQEFSFDDNEKSCGANPLVAFEESYEGSEIKVTSLSQGKNCWTDATYSTSEMTCVGENKASKAFTVFCDAGKYKYFDGSTDQPADYKEGDSQAKAFADETCGTAAILPVSLLVGALALLVSRA